MEKEFTQLLTLLESKQFRFTADKAIPSGFAPVNYISAPNTLDISDSLAIADLPFYGRAYYAEYSRCGGIVFNSAAQEYNLVSNPKRHTVTITFKAKGETDLYHIRIIANAGYSGTVIVTSNNRSSISFLGTFEGLAKEKAENE